MKKAIGKLDLFGFLAIIMSMILAACGDSPTATTQPTTTAPVTTAAQSTTTTSATPFTTAATTTAVATTTTAALTTKATGAQGEQEITFTSGKDTIYGTFLLPEGAKGKLPAVLIIAGGGPSDRNGNFRGSSGETNILQNFARLLGEQGVASLRYDKLSSGKTGFGSYSASSLDIGLDVFLDEAKAAYAFLKSRPEVDPQRIMILGHSEGGLFALLLADQLKATNGVKALVLAAPLSTPYLDTIKRQLTEQYQQAVQLGQVKKEEADAALAELDMVNKSLLETGKLPTTISTAAIKQIFSVSNAKFFSEAGKYDPGKLAAGLPVTLPVLVLHGQKDSQVAVSDMQNLMQGFQKAGNTKAELHELVNVNHFFKEVTGTPNPEADYINPALPFSKEAAQFTVAFVKANL